MHPLAEKVLQRDLRATARACRLADDAAPGHTDILKSLFPHTGKAWILGITGNPGAGKSTLTDRVVEELRKQNRRVGVVAIDPTSPFTGGAILGDRIRMQRHFEDPDVFIRSLATRGALGGLSRSAADIVRILDAWGADVVIVETVGVGQDEIEITTAAHTTLVVMAPGLGDDIQAIKAGILECADVFAVNKADRDGADTTVRDLELMIALGGEMISAGAHTRGHAKGVLDVKGQEVRHAKEKWVPPIQKTVASKGTGVRELLEKLEKHRRWLDETEAGKARRAERMLIELQRTLRDELVLEAVAALGPAIEEAAEAVARREVDPYTASEQLIARFRQS